MVGVTGTALLTGKGDEHLVMAVRTADAGETFLQIAAREKGGHAAVDHRSPEAVLGLKLLVVDMVEGTVIDKHPDTPWAARAEKEMGSGFGIHLYPHYRRIPTGTGTSPLISVSKL